MPWKGGGMLNQRQMEIILQMFETPEIRRTTSELAEERQVSMRTIQTDLKVIREALADRPCVSFISDRRGSMVHITDPDGFEELKEQTRTPEERESDYILYTAANLMYSMGCLHDYACIPRELFPEWLSVSEEQSGDSEK